MFDALSSGIQTGRTGTNLLKYINDTFEVHRKNRSTIYLLFISTLHSILSNALPITLLITRKKKSELFFVILWDYKNNVFSSKEEKKN